MQRKRGQKKPKRSHFLHLNVQYVIRNKYERGNEGEKKEQGEGMKKVHLRTQK